MSSPDFPEPPPSVPATSLADCDTKLALLAENAQAWVDTTIPERIAILEQTITASVAEAEGWVDAGCKAKGIAAGDAQAGEEWLAGPVTFVRNLRLLVNALKEGGQPQLPSVRTHQNGQKIAQVFPGNLLDKIMFTGVTADVWIEPGEGLQQGRIYREKATGSSGTGRVGLILGAGNVASIGPMDALYKLFVDDEVVILKTNPVNSYLGPFIERSFAPFAARGWFAIAHGGAEQGAHLCQHDLVTSIHITGSDSTHDVIVWGTDPEDRKRRMEAGDPVNTKPISSELGAVTPVMVVPGDWSDAELEFQARHVASMVANNGSFNCNAAKVLVMASGWSQRAQFVGLVHKALAGMKPRKAYYPGAENRYEAFLENYPDAQPLGERHEGVVPWTVLPDVKPESGEYALSNEAFCGVLAETVLEASDAAEFLPKVVEFANDVCFGTLSCMMLIHPRTEKENQAAYEAAIEGLTYGGIAVNCWAGLIYGLVVTPWGAHPGHTLEDIKSGRGVVHNTYMLEDVQKTVVKAPFRINPTPAWFADHKTQDQLGRALLGFEATGSWTKLPGVIWAAMRG
jgi:acyl-CoA reductase-like NAD-dependent aldehyde dehydrogenase